MGFIEKLKEIIEKIKEENRNFKTTMARMNGTGFCGNVNRGIKNGDFWEGSYISIEGTGAVIYGSNQDDYAFTDGDIASFETASDSNITVSVGDKTHRGVRCILVFHDGKRAQVDVIADKLATLKTTLKIG